MKLLCKQAKNNLTSYNGEHNTHTHTHGTLEGKRSKGPKIQRFL